MNITEIVPFLKENADKIKVHCAIGRINKHEPLFNFSSNKFKEWQEEQNKRNFEREYILSLIYMKKSEWLFAGVFSRKDVKELPNGKIQYITELLNVSKELIGRLVVSFDKEFRASYLLLENYLQDMVVCEILRNPYKIDPFPGFDSVRIGFDFLKEVYAENEKTWMSALSNVKGVYLIADTKTGKLYVGSAYGEEAFWQRWKKYIETGHGGNVKLKDLIQENGFEYVSNFGFSILEIRNMATDDDVIIKRESYWKDCLLSRRFGYNDN